MPMDYHNFEHNKINWEMLFSPLLQISAKILSLVYKK